MNCLRISVILSVCAIASFACSPTTTGNPFDLLGQIDGSVDPSDISGFLGFDGIGSSLTGGASDAGTGGIVGSVIIGADLFRPQMTVVLTNNAGVQLVETKLLAYIFDENIPSGELRDEAVTQLSGNGWVLQGDDNSVISVGRVEIPGRVWLRTGPAIAGAVPVKIASSEADLGSVVDSITGVDEVTFQFITPDGILLFSDLPESCDSLAFLYTENGVAIPGPSEAEGGQKAIRHMGRYQCDPFNPGFFLKIEGASLENEYELGESIFISFNAGTDENLDFAVVTIEVPTVSNESNE